MRQCALFLLLGSSSSLAPLGGLRSAPQLETVNKWLSSTCSSYEKNVEVASFGSMEGSKEEEDWGLALQRDVRRGDVIIEVPLSRCLVASGAYEGALGARLLNAEELAGEPFGAFCGEASLVALQLANGDASREWADAFPSLETHPLIAEDEEEEKEQTCWSSRSLEALRANAKDDYDWLNDQGVLTEDECSWEKWRYALGLAMSRGIELDGELTLAPGLDFANHDDILEPFDAECGAKVKSGFFGAGEKSVQLVAPLDGKKGDELRISYGGLNAAEYYERYGFSPSKGAARRASASCELRFELLADERFIDDKRGILERAEVIEEDDEETIGFEFQVGGALDAELLKFCRLAQLAGSDAFLLEPVFEAEVWGHLDLPVSEENERLALESVVRECAAVAESLQTPNRDDAQRELVRRTELAALEATLEAVDAELATLSQREYYQERRLKDLGLDTEWSQDEAQWAAARSPGSVDW